MRRKALSLLALALIAALGITLGLGNSRAGMRATAIASLYLSPIGSDANPCTQAAPCQTPEKACEVTALNGDDVLMEPGAYTADVLPQGTSKITSDCSGGRGNDANPNNLSQTPSGWTTFRCNSAAKDACVLSSLAGGGGRLTFQGNCHCVFDGGSSKSIYIHNADFGQGPDTSLTTQNVRLTGVHMDSAEIVGARNIEIANSEAGPVIICGTVSTLPAQDKCDPNGPAFEAQFASRCCANYGGNTDWEGTQWPKIKPNAGGVQSVNVRIENVWAHDIQTKDAGLWHDGCGIIQNGSGLPDGSIVFDRFTCERDTIQGLFLESSSGVTVTRSTFTCPTYPVNDPLAGGQWARCASAQSQLLIKSGVAKPTNLLFSYNSFATTANAINFGGYAYSSADSIREIGNLLTVGASCPAGVFADYNTGCGSHQVPLSGDPYADDDAGSVYATASQINMSLNGTCTACAGAVPNLGADYTVVGATAPFNVGAWQSTMPPPPPPTTTATTTSTTATTATTTATTSTASTTTATTTTPSPRFAQFKQFVADAQAASYYSKWSAQNPGELSRWSAFRDALLAGNSATVPTMSTKYGASLVDAGILYLG